MAWRKRRNDDDEQGRGAVTARADGRVYCRVCGCRVNSRLGQMCSRPRCHRRAVLAEMED